MKLRVFLCTSGIFKLICNGNNLVDHIFFFCTMKKVFLSDVPKYISIGQFFCSCLPIYKKIWVTRKYTKKHYKIMTSIIRFLYTQAKIFLVPLSIRWSKKNYCLHFFIHGLLMRWKFHLWFVITLGHFVVKFESLWDSWSFLFSCVLQSHQNISKIINLNYSPQLMHNIIK